MATHETAAELSAPHCPSPFLTILDEAGQSTEVMATIPLCQTARSGARLVAVGDVQQLEPTVVSEKAVSLGMQLSLLHRLHDSLGDSDECNVLLRVSYRMHPTLLQWPSFAFYNGLLVSGLLNPLIERPPIAGLPWRKAKPLPLPAGATPDTYPVGRDEYRNPVHSAQGCGTGLAPLGRCRL